MVAWTRVVVVVEEMERRTPQVPPALLKPIFSLDPVTRMCSRICSTGKLVHTSGLCWSLLSQEAFSRQCQSPEVFQKLCMSSALPILTPDASLWLWSTPGDAFISLVVLLSPAVRLENLRLDHLVAGAAHHEVEVVMCGIMAK